MGGVVDGQGVAGGVKLGVFVVAQGPPAEHDLIAGRVLPTMPEAPVLMVGADQGLVEADLVGGLLACPAAALAALDGSRHTTIYLGAPGVGLRGMSAAITSALSGAPRFHCSSLIPLTQDLLAAETAERGKKVTVVVDEAHLLDADTLEGLRCLSNAGMGSRRRSP